MTEWLQGNLGLLMFAALGLAIFCGLPVAFVLGGVGLAFGLVGIAVGPVRAADFGAIYHRVYGTLADSEDVLWAAVPLLVFMGTVLHESGIARDLLLALQRVLRRVPGGLGMAVTALGIVLAPAAGMVGASVSTLGLMALPTMLERGYPPPAAAATVAAAGTLGVALPPAIMLFFLADAMGVQIPAVFLAMVGPGALLVALYVAYLGVSGAVRAAPAPTAAGAGEPMQAEVGLANVARSLAVPVGLIAAVLGSVVMGWASPSESAGIGAAGALLVGLAGRGLSKRGLHRAVAQTTMTTAMVFLIFVGATTFSLMFRLLGGVDRLAAGLGALSLGPWGSLLTVLGIILALGCFIDWLEIVLVTFVVFRPVLDGLDFTGHAGSPYLAATWITALVALVLQASFLTPPFGFALFFVKAAAPARIRMGDVYRGIVPFIAIQFAAVALVALFPALATWLPDRVLDLRAASRSIKGWE